MEARDLSDVYQITGFQPLNRIWAQLEILLGLATAGIGLFLAMHRDPPVPLAEIIFSYAGPLGLFILGSYLAMAAHRSHLYQSNIRLVAYLAAVIRQQHTSGERS